MFARLRFGSKNVRDGTLNNIITSAEVQVDFQTAMSENYLTIGVENSFNINC